MSTLVEQKTKDFCEDYPLILNCQKVAAPIIKRVVGNCTEGYPDDNQMVKRETCIDKESVDRNRTLIDQYYPAGAGSTPTPQPQPAASAPGAAAPAGAPAGSSGAPAASASDGPYWQFRLECLKQGKTFNQVSGNCDGSGGPAAADPKATKRDTGFGFEIAGEATYFNLASETTKCIPTPGAAACRTSHEPYPFSLMAGPRYNGDKFALIARGALLVAPGFSREGASIPWSWLAKIQLLVELMLTDEVSMAVGPEVIYIPDSYHLGHEYSGNKTPVGGRGEGRYHINDTLDFFVGGEAHVTPGSTPDSRGVDNPIGGWSLSSGLLVRY